MGFTVRFMLGTFLVLLCFWSAQTTQLNRLIRQVSHNESQTTEKLQEVQAESSTDRIVANLTEESSKPKTDFSTDNKTVDNTNVISKVQKAETAPEIARSIDIEKYVSKEFHNKNNVYTLPSSSSDTEKYIDPEFQYHATTHTHNYDFDYHSELTTPKSSIFDDRYKEAVESVDQKLEHIDESHELSSETESKESPNLDKLYEETQKNDTKADLNYVNYKNIVSNDTNGKNTLHKDLVVEAGTNLDFHSSYNHTTVIDEDDSGNNTIAKEPDEKKIETSTLSNIIPDKGDLDHADTSTSKSTILTTRKSNILTKPPSNRNSSHISILSNNIETETVKAINPVQSTTTDKPKGEKEIVSELFINKTRIVIAKRPFMVAEEPRTESPIDNNNINKKSEQLLQENQVIPVHVEAPPTVKNITTESPTEDINSTTPRTVLLKTQNESTIQTTLPTTEVPSTIPTTSEITTTQEAITLITTERTTTEAPTKPPSITTMFPALETTTVPTSLVDLIIESTKQPETTETETMTSVVTETSISPWTKLTTTAATVELKTSTPEVTTLRFEPETTTLVVSTTVAPTIQSDGTTVSTITTTVAPPATTTPVDAEPTKTTTIETTTTTATVELVTTTEIPLNTNTESDIVNRSSTTENSVRTSKEMVYKDVTTVTEASQTEVPTEPVTTTSYQTTEVVETTIHEMTMAKIEEPETTTSLPVTVNPSTRVLPDFRHIAQTDSSVEVETTTENNTITSEYYENPEPNDDNSGTIAAITISSIGAVCLILLAGLLVIMRKRQKRFNYGQRCTPVSLDDYSMDNVSVYNSVRRKGLIRGSKRSYGNPAFEDPVCVSHPLNFPALGKFANNMEDIKAEFEEIPQITARTNELPEGCDTKNRYANVIPLPETRVFLTLIDGYPNSDYINANYVTGPKNIKGYYIACQAPLQNTVDDFWRMIWEQQCKVVLMLTHLFENGIEKCVDYLPPSEVLDCHRLFGDFQVTLKKREVKDKYIISSLQLKNMVSNSWREVTHFWYLGWPEKGVPSEANSLIAFLIEARSYMKSSSLDRKDVTNGNLTNGMTKNELNPVVVHCSPGTGRTGVVIACDIAIREFEQTRLIDVPRIVYKIRRDRASAVQTKEQYAFIYKVINFYATKLTGGALDSL